MKKSGLLLVISMFILVLSWATAAYAEEDTSQPPDLFHNLKFRDLGPAAAGGRVSAVAGIPGNPNIYYVGGAAGGVWKTTDGGLSWSAVFEHQATASIGAIALAPSNPNLIWVGTGEANIRNNVMDGAGIYFSPDAGKSWRFMGLKDAGQISKVIVDPADPDTVWVGVLGHTWGANPDRGVFKTTDGGKTWKKVLFVSDQAGVADMAIAPSNPKVLFAALWQAVRHPWELLDGGKDSGIWRSEDGGDTWTKLSKDLPEGPLGRIALAVAPSDENRVYTLIEAKRDEGLLWSSSDMGDHWSKVSSSYTLDVRPFYFSHLAVSPDDPDRVYFLSFFMMLSKDGGHTAHPTDLGVHVDHHAIWIDPTDPKRIIQGNDGGAFLSVDEGANWRFLDGLPIEQDYMVSTDGKRPYSLCGGLQDNSAWCGTSNSLANGQIDGNDWYSIVGGDGEYSENAPSDPNTVNDDSQDGAISRFDLKNKRSAFLMPYLHGGGFILDMKTADQKYRFNWTTPIAVSPTDANTLFLGGNVLFKSTDGGVHWTVLSGDLTRNDKSKQGLSGGDINKDLSGAEAYDTLLSITLAPNDPNVIWTGTDDGLVQLSKDGGKNWNDVTPSGAPKWERVYQVGVSPFDAGTAYVSFDGHMLDDKHAYVYRTDNYGKSWSRIDKGLPDDPVMVVRESPQQKGFLVLGSTTGLWYSRDSGAHWQRMRAGFPTVPVFDVKFEGDDLVVASHGRGLLVFDDIKAFEQMDDAVTAQDFHLFGAGDGTRFIRWFRGGESQVSYAAPNAPNGVVVDYYLKKELKATPDQKAAEQTPVKIVVTDAKGAVVATKYGPSKDGVNRFVWNMQYDAPTKLAFEKTPDLNGGDGFGNFGPSVLAGTYNIAVTVNGKTETTQAKVAYDPNQTVAPDEAKTLTVLGLKARNELSAYNEMMQRLHDMQDALGSFQGAVNGNADLDKAKYQAALDQAKALQKSLGDLKDSVYNTDEQKETIEDNIHYLAKLDIQLQFLFFGSAGSDPQPMIQSILDLDAELTPKVNDALARFNALLKKDVPDYNKAAYTAGAPTLMVGDPVVIKPVPAL